MRKVTKLLLLVLSLSLFLAIAFACEPSSGDSTCSTAPESDEPISFEPTADDFFEFHYIANDEKYADTYFVMMPQGMPDGVTKETYPKDIVVPSEYEGKPVIGFATSAGCTKGAVKRVVFPKTIQKVANLRASFPNLEKIYVEEGSKWLKVKQNCLIDNDGVLVAAVNNASIPNDGSVLEIAETAFALCRDIKEITIPDSVTKIGGGAFAYSSIEKVSIGKGLTEWDWTPFAGTIKLSSITVSSQNAKYYSKNNCIIEKETKRLVQACKTSVIPAGGSVTTIGNGSFAGFVGIEEFDLDDYIDSGLYVFPRVTESKAVDLTIPEGVTCIEKSAISAAYIENLNLPKSIGEIKNRAFDMCKIGRVNYSGDIVSWNNLGLSHDIEGCMSCSSPVSYGTKFFINGIEVKEIEFPAGTTEITASFSYLSTLTKVIIPSSVTKIANRAFYKYRPSDIGIIIEYKGTIEQWNAIEKGYEIVSGTATVICTDGEVLLG